MLSINDQKPTLEFDGRLKCSADERCPHGTIRDLLGTSTVAAMIDYVGEREAAFEPGSLRRRGSGERRIDAAVLDSLVLRGLGPFQERFETAMRAIAPLAVAQLGLAEPAVEPREFEFASYGDGGHFNVHLDTVDRVRHVRILSCVYYFSVTPRRFTGGALRLHGFPDPLRGSEKSAVDITPESDMLVMFPSWMEHEVRPVQVPSGAWIDRRFSINCWIHRANTAA